MFPRENSLQSESSCHMLEDFQGSSIGLEVESPRKDICEGVTSKFSAGSTASQDSLQDLQHLHLDDRTPNPCKVFVGGIGQATVQSSLKSHFCKYGDVADCVIVSDRKSGRSRGFGFVTFQDPSSVQGVLKDKHKIDNVLVECRLALPREEARDTAPYDTMFMPNKLFVGGIPDKVDEDLFREYFGQFGSIIDVSLAYDKSKHRPRGFGFILYQDTTSVDAAVGKHQIGGKMIEAKRAIPRQPSSTTKTKTKTRQQPETTQFPSVGISGVMPYAMFPPTFPQGFELAHGLRPGLTIPGVFPRPILSNADLLYQRSAVAVMAARLQNFAAAGIRAPNPATVAQIYQRLPYNSVPVEVPCVMTQNKFDASRGVPLAVNGIVPPTAHLLKRAAPNFCVPHPNFPDMKNLPNPFDNTLRNISGSASTTASAGVINALRNPMSVQFHQNSENQLVSQNVDRKVSQNLQNGTLDDMQNKEGEAQLFNRFPPPVHNFCAVDSKQCVEGVSPYLSGTPPTYLPHYAEHMKDAALQSTDLTNTTRLIESPMLNTSHLSAPFSNIAPFYSPLSAALSSIPFVFKEEDILPAAAANTVSTIQGSPLTKTTYFPSTPLSNTNTLPFSPDLWLRTLPAAAATARKAGEDTATSIRMNIS